MVLKTNNAKSLLVVVITVKAVVTENQWHIQAALYSSENSTATQKANLDTKLTCKQNAL